MFRLLLSAVFGFLTAFGSSELVIRIIDAFSSPAHRTGLDILASAAANATIRVFIIGVGTPLIGFLLYRNLFHRHC